MAGWHLSTQGQTENSFSPAVAKPMLHLQLKWLQKATVIQWFCSYGSIFPTQTKVFNSYTKTFSFQYQVGRWDASTTIRKKLAYLSPEMQHSKMQKCHSMKSTIITDFVAVISVIKCEWNDMFHSFHFFMSEMQEENMKPEEIRQEEGRKQPT